MDRQKINSRIQKLQAIANDPGATPAEVESAKRLIARHRAVTHTPTMQAPDPILFYAKMVWNNHIIPIRAWNVSVNVKA